MSTTSTPIYIDIAFIPIYCILFVLLAINLYNHRKHGLASFGFPAVFALSRVIGNACLVGANYVHASPSTVKNLYTAGTIVQSVGFAFLVNSALAFLPGVVGKEEKKRPGSGGIVGLLSRPQKLAHLLALIATILVIVGMTSINFTPEILQGGAPVDLGTESKIGSLLFIGIVILLGVTIVYFLALSGRTYDQAQTFTLQCLLFNILPTLLRSIFLCYRVFGSKNYFKVNVWAQLALQYVPELIIVAVFTALGFLLTYKFNVGSSETPNELEQSHFLGQPPYSTPSEEESESKTNFPAA